MSFAILVETVLSEARRAAMTGGLTRVCRIHLRRGRDASISAEEFESELSAYLKGPLFSSCAVVVEEVTGHDVVLASIEGYTPETA